MNFQALFTTTRVVVSVYRLVSTTLLLAYIIRRQRRQRGKQQSPLYRKRDLRSKAFMYDDN